ncbi:Uncharacterised protein [Streptococcus pseudoporcinus]|uniref:Thiazolylpeptide-type bacteriocin n=1 Tax=Streptococcus pseudoporcinus TaxID=361101 RepID=A0A4U9YSK9_9STRE|nr:thiocillin [Streptococcus pseudoporcinus]VTS29978.1 Uncharacterised protein [Streptococcus pseudoporcinus]
MFDNDINLLDAAIENLDVSEFEVLSNDVLSEANEKTVIGASCTTCVCTCSSCCSA